MKTTKEIEQLRNNSRELQAQKRELEEKIKANDRALSQLMANTILLT